MTLPVGSTACLLTLVGASIASAQGRDRSPQDGPAATLSQVLGRPTDRSAALSVLSAGNMDAFVEYGFASGTYVAKSPVGSLKSGAPTEFELIGLEPDTTCFYRLRTRPPGDGAFQAGEEFSFHTQRPPGAAFTFALQGDSHPERLGKMYDPVLYDQTMRNVAGDAPDLYLTLGDDFSVEHLIGANRLSQIAVDRLYAHQRGFLGLVGRGAPLFLVNGNHEEAARVLLDGTPDNVAVYAGKARTRFFPLPAPDAFYSGDPELVEHIGLLRDYFAWTWGDALFVVIDPYWHSAVQVDGELGGKKPAQKDEKGGGKRGRDLWNVTLGDAQYRWLQGALRSSNAKFKFVFCHHVMGTGRGGIEMASKFEWGGADNRGVNRFFQNRPDWDQPIHDLFKETGVSILFQGHDHLYAHQQLDGVTYQSVPNPADPSFTAFNREAYLSGDIFPNSGHLRVTVSPTSTRVEYVRSFRKADEGPDRINAAVAHSYTIAPRTPTSPAPAPGGSR